jgi:hypothetical protein
MTLDLSLYRFSEVITRMIVKGNVRPLARKNLTQRRPYPSRSAGYERTPSFK